HPSISRSHAKITVEGERVKLIDLGSNNGTLVNGRRITGEHLLQANEVVTIYKTTLLLHAPPPASTAAIALAAPDFHERIQAELDRALRYERRFTVLCAVWREPVRNRRSVEQVVCNQLRRSDAVSWTNDRTLHVLLAEVHSDAAVEIADRVRAKLGSDAQVG